MARSGIRLKALNGSEPIEEGADVAGVSISSSEWPRPSAHYSRSVVYILSLSY